MGYWFKEEKSLGRGAAADEIRTRSDKADIYIPVFEEADADSLAIYFGTRVQESCVLHECSALL